MKNLINWFEIPVSDFERAVRFYEHVFLATFRREDMADMRMAIFPYTEPCTGGALLLSAHYKPSNDGVVIYLHADDLTAMLERVSAGGGRCVLAPMVLPDDIGAIAVIIDCEGNRIGLHQPPSA